FGYRGRVKDESEPVAPTFAEIMAPRQSEHDRKLVKSDGFIGVSNELIRNSRLHGFPEIVGSIPVSSPSPHSSVNNHRGTSGNNMFRIAKGGFRPNVRIPANDGLH